MTKIKINTRYLKRIWPMLMILIAIWVNTGLVLGQSGVNNGSFAAGNSDNLITVNKNSSYVIKFELTKETLVNIALFDEFDKLTMILLYEYIRPGVLEFDLAKYIPRGNHTCKIMIGENTETLRLLVI
jgi:hypothetical protein